MRRHVCAGFLATLAAASPAGAVPVLELVGGVEADRPLAGAAGVRGGDAAYQNPAALDFDAPGFSLSVFSIIPDLDVALDARPAGYDVPTSVRDARRVLPDGSTARLDRRPLPTSELPRARGSAEPAEGATFARLGVSFPVWADHLSLGLTAVLPLAGLQAQSPFFTDEREQAFSNSLHFERLGDRLTLSTFTLALAGRFGDHLAVGAGVTLHNQAQATAQLYIPDAGDVSQADDQTAVAVEPAFAPHFGVVAWPLGDARLRVAATVHLPSENTSVGRSELRFFDYDYPEGQDALISGFEYSFAHEPLRAGLGVA